MRVLSQQGDQGVPGWNFTLEEMSYGAWHAVGRHFDGRSVSRMGSDEMALLQECVREALALTGKRDA